MLPEKISFKHGVSEKGELQVYKVTKFFKDGKYVGEEMDSPYSPKDTDNMEGFDSRSIEIAKVISADEAKAELAVEIQTPTEAGLEEIISYDRMIDEEGKIAVRKVARIYKDGKEISKKYHRSWLNPGDDYSKADVMSKTLAKGMHTKECIAKFKAKAKESAKGLK